MASVSATSQAAGIVEFASGSFTGDATITTVSIGFKPRWIKVFNSTDAIVWEWFEGMAATTVIKTVTAGTTTADTTSAITIDSGNKAFVLTAALAASGKAISWVAQS